MKRSPCFECDVTGKIKDVKHYKVFVYETDEKGEIVPQPAGDCLWAIAYESPKRDLCPASLNRLVGFIKRGLTPARTPPDRQAALLAPPEPPSEPEA